MGHFIAAKNCGLDVGVPVFIPFVGAWISLKAIEITPENEAYIGLAGPLLGTVGAFCYYLVALDNGEKIWMALAYSGFFINLFNLIPLGPLDGGKIVGAISPKLWLFGVPILLGLFLWKPSPMLVVVAILALPRVWSALTQSIQGSVINSQSLKIKLGIQYLSLVALLAIFAFDAHERILV